MSLWAQWHSVVAPLRAACSRQRSFLWLLVALAGICARRDLLGVTSIVRTLGLTARCHDRLLDFFHSPAVDVGSLTRLWTQRALALFPVHRRLSTPARRPRTAKTRPAASLRPESQVVDVVRLPRPSLAVGGRSRLRRAQRHASLALSGLLESGRRAIQR